VEQERLSFTSRGRALRGTLQLAAAPGPLPCVVLCHGFGSYDDDLGGFVRLAGFLAENGLASYRFSFAGSHPYREKGTVRPAGEWVDNALGAVARVGRHPRIDAARLGLLGVSVGGGVAIQAAALTASVRAVVALAPVADGEDWLRHRWISTRGPAAWERFVADVEADHGECVMGRASRLVDQFDVQSPGDRPGWNALLKRFPGILSKMSLASACDTFHFKPLFFARMVTQPLCLIQGDADESVPLEHSRLIHQEAGGPKELTILTGAPHCPWETAHESLFQQIALKWFLKWLGRPHD